MSLRILHFTPYSLFFTPSTLLFTPSTLLFTPSTLLFTLYTHSYHISISKVLNVTLDTSSLQVSCISVAFLI